MTYLSCCGGTSNHKFSCYRRPGKGARGYATSDDSGNLTMTTIFGSDSSSDSSSSSSSDSGSSGGCE